MVDGSGHPDWECIIHYLTNELLVKKHTVSDAQATFHVKEGKQACLIFQVFLFITG
jgi:hypothetical protein